MAENGLKMVKFFWGASHMINKNILILHLHLVSRAIFFKFGQKSGFVKYLKRRSSKTKNVKMI